jgi:sugar lactone lactonase YvrE
LLVALPYYCNTPDGMAIQPDGSFILSVPNFNDEKFPPVLMKITADNKAEKWFDLPPVPGAADNVKRIGTMGICRAPSGDIFLADMQLKDPKQKSRLWRIVTKDGKAEKMVLVADGFNVSNGIAIRGEYVYVTESVLVPDSHPLVSAVMRFKLTDEGVTLKTPLKDDPHVLTTFQSTNEDWRFGADGIAFDSKGNLFVGMFGDGIIYKVELNADGTVKSNKLFAKAPGKMINCDGMSCDTRSDKLYVADSANNAIQCISPDGSIQPLSINGTVTDKRSGLLCQPCEAMVRGDTVVVSNMNWPFPKFKNLKHMMPATLSVVRLNAAKEAPKAPPAAAPAPAPAPAPKAAPTTAPATK